ncbi:hypothetical protein FRC01_002010 [Tulasnella sp. 417]|nr:hypothetical protein FRC01_002010 [Tulasnella sp. 417]
MTLTDLRMGALSYALRSKPGWWNKYKDPMIRATWEKEALKMEIQGARLSEAEVQYFLDELQGHEKMRDETTGIQQSCFQCIYEADDLVSEDLRNRLIEAVKVLEDVPDDKKDWHPGGNKQVLNLVHPSMYCIIYDRTLAFPLDSDPVKRTSADLKKLHAPFVAAALKTGPKPDYPGWSYSPKFCWIPTDFEIAPGGQPAKALSYINNIDPDHTELYSVIEGVVGRFSLLWDRVLTDIRPESGAMRYRITEEAEWNSDLAGPEPYYGRFNSPEHAAWTEWCNRRELVIPSVPRQGYTEDISHRNNHYTIQGKKVQVIVKLVNIILTPENPSYPGGSWHIEGLANESIVASGIYYYDSENITGSYLAFRMAVSGIDETDEEITEKVFGLGRESASNQVVGTVKTASKRCIAFPNLFQHRVSPFALADPTKPGYSKIMALLLVDPERRIASTSNVPPQQMHWAQAAMATSEPFSAFSLLPTELHQMVAESTDSLMSETEAKDYRLKLMDERATWVRVQNGKWFCAPFVSRYG